MNDDYLEVSPTKQTTSAADQEEQKYNLKLVYSKDIWLVVRVRASTKVSRVIREFQEKRMSEVDVGQLCLWLNQTRLEGDATFDEIFKDELPFNNIQLEIKMVIDNPEKDSDDKELSNS